MVGQKNTGQSHRIFIARKMWSVGALHQKQNPRIQNFYVYDVMCHIGFGSSVPDGYRSGFVVKIKGTNMNSRSESLSPTRKVYRKLVLSPMVIA
jgi:hypothetical protein